MSVGIDDDQATRAADAAAKRGEMTEEQCKPYFRPGLCRACRRPIDVLTVPVVSRLKDGRILNGVGAQTFATCQRCIFVAGTPAGILAFNRPVPPGPFDPGEVLVSPGAMKRFGYDLIGRFLIWYTAGDFGLHGHAADPASDEAKAADPRALPFVGSPGDRNGIAIASGVGIVRARYEYILDKSRGRETLAVATLLGEPGGPRTIVYSPSMNEPGP